jgi:hypothetical protein
VKQEPTATKPTEAPTLKTHRSSTVLLVGVGETLGRRVERAAIKLGAKVASVEPTGASSFMMQTVPHAVVVGEPADIDPALLTVSRELGIRVLRISGDDCSDEHAEQLVADAMTMGAHPPRA